MFPSCIFHKCINSHSMINTRDFSAYQIGLQSMSLASVTLHLICTVSINLLWSRKTTWYIRVCLWINVCVYTSIPYWCITAWFVYVYSNRGCNKINYIAIINNIVYKFSTANSDNQQCELNKHTKWYTFLYVCVVTSTMHIKP